MPITIYGIKNCDTMKKARAWLDKHGVAYVFHDYKTQGIARERLERWEKKVGWETLLNRAGTTFRKLPDKDKTATQRQQGLEFDARAALDDQTARARTSWRQIARGIFPGTLQPIVDGLRCVPAPSRLPAVASSPRFTLIRTMLGAPSAAGGPPIDKRRTPVMIAARVSSKAQKTGRAAWALH